MRRAVYIAVTCGLLSGSLMLWRGISGQTASPPVSADGRLDTAPAPSPSFPARHTPTSNTLPQVKPQHPAEPDRETADRHPFAVSGYPALRPSGRLADPGYRLTAVQDRHAKYVGEKTKALAKAANEGWSTDSGRSIRERDPKHELMAIRNGRVLVYRTENVNAAITTAANLVRNHAPYNVDGSDIIVGVWDGGHARSTHVEFGNRITIKDPGSIHYHSTHVFGTIAAAGISPNAMGMAPGVTGESYEWEDDLSEMTARAMAAPSETNAIQMSNHSYGHVTGWDYYYWPPRWYGTWGSGYRESDYFGSYTEETADWDALCYDAPYFLPVKSAGNDRTDSAPAPGQTFEYYDGGWITKYYDPAVDPLADNWDSGGFDTIPDIGNAKNILTVGAVGDAAQGGLRALEKATMMTFSGWGPTDDGRVKPDVVANGDRLYSTDSDHDHDYTTLSGTSMAAPNVTGSAVLIASYHRALFSGAPILSSTLKGLIIHTADDIGRAGPDYENGWGLMNTMAAVEYLRIHSTYPDAGMLREDALDSSNAIDTFTIVWNGSDPLKVTLYWTDPPGVQKSGLDNRTPDLVNDLDLRISAPDGTTWTPFLLDPDNPPAPATTGDNTRDNVEQIILPSPEEGTLYTVTVSHKGSLEGGVQSYSLFTGGIGTPPCILHTPIENTSNTNDPYTVEASITALDPVDPDSLWLYWTTDPTGSDFPHSNRLVHISGDLYGSAIPPQPLFTRITYYLYASTSNNLISTHPANAPPATHIFYVAPQVSLTVFGSPDENGPVQPDYGAHLYPSGITVNASAALTNPDREGHRYACNGWIGFGHVPSGGTSNTLSFSIGRDSLLIWQWSSQYLLTQTSTVPGIIETDTWWEESSTGSTVTAQSSATIGNTTYRFAGWQIDGVRQPGPVGRAVNPAEGFIMSASREATALYLPENEDTDGDDLGDWWEQYYFGSLASAPEDDPDHDGYLNIEEYEDRSDPGQASSTPAGPMIVHAPLQNPIPHPAPFTVNATVTDNHAVRDVILRWRRNGLNWRQAPMLSQGSTSLYTGTIPEPGTMGDIFEYVIVATDQAGYLVEDGIHQTFVAYPLLRIAPHNISVTIPEATVTNSAFTIWNDGNTGLTWNITAHGVGLDDTVESGTNGWTHYGQRDLWHITTNRSYSSHASWYCGDDASQQYLDGMESSLVTPPILLGDNPVLSFMQWCNTELDIGDYTWDGGVVEISTDGGATYRFITPDGGYPYLVVNNPASPFSPDTPCMGGTGGWERITFDLSEYGGMEVLIRFRFGSDGWIVDEGWYLDDILVTPCTGTNTWLTLPRTTGAVRSGYSTNVEIGFNTAILPGTAEESLMLRVQGNDPIDDSEDLLATVHVLVRPQVASISAAQTSLDGSGKVTISNVVYDANGDLCSMELMFSTNSGQTWSDLWVGAAESSLRPVFINNGYPRQLLGIATTNNASPAANSLSIVWETTNGLERIQLAQDTIVRARVWDGMFWGDAVTSFPFIVDNEAPSAPGSLTVSSHLPNEWSTNGSFDATWPAASDNAGIGIAGYRVLATGEPAADPHGAHFTSGHAAVVTAPCDGTNIRVMVYSVDDYGNTSDPIHAGPFRIDTTPPSPEGASIEFALDANGDYIIGPDIHCSWSGFTDAASGISGYYVALTNGGGTDSGAWAAVTAATVAGAAKDQTNTVYVWARDNCGLIGASAQAQVLVLASETDWDNDGLSTAQETICGTDASDQANVLWVHESIVPTSSTLYQHVLTWYGVSNRFYSLYETTNLIDAVWQPVTSHLNIPGTNGTITYIRPLTVYGYRFYRITATE